MTARRSMLVRWTEQTEAAQICAMAMLEHEPQNIAACPVIVVRHPVSLRRRVALLLHRLTGEGLQIARDVGR